jgi:hypothetical protein
MELKKTKEIKNKTKNFKEKKLWFENDKASIKVWTTCATYNHNHCTNKTKH